MAKSKSASGIEYSKVAEVKGPLLVVEGIDTAAFEELVEVEDVDGGKRLGRVLESGFGKAVIQVFEGTSGLSVSGTKAKFLGKTMELPVSDELLGRVFDGLGRPLDGLPEPVGKEFRDVNGAPINPDRREYPIDIIQTGVSAIDVMLTLVRGQKPPSFRGLACLTIFWRRRSPGRPLWSVRERSSPSSLPHLVPSTAKRRSSRGRWKSLVRSGEAYST